MCPRRSAAIVALLVFAIAGACKTSSNEPTDAGGEGARDAATADAGTPRVPLHHRASAPTCASAAVAPEPPPSANPSDCQRHADCTAKSNGRCVARGNGGPAFPSGNRCLYDECASDDACGGTGVCACATDEARLCAAPDMNHCNRVDPAIVACVVQQAPQPDGSSSSFGDTCSCGQANVCVTGNCRVDADCGPAGYCSPGRDTCDHFGGWFCHTSDDACVDDADCTGAGELCHPPSALLGIKKWQCFAASSCP